MSKVRKELRKFAQKLRGEQKHYRGLTYTKEFKEEFEGYVGLKLKRIIDRYLDERISKVIFVGTHYKHVIEISGTEETELRINTVKEFLNDK